MTDDTRQLPEEHPESGSPARGIIYRRGRSRQLRDRAVSGKAARIRCRAYFSTRVDGQKWWLANQYDSKALHLKARELAASGMQEISALLTDLACQQTVQKAGSDLDNHPDHELDYTPFQVRLINFCRHEYDADWRGFERFYQHEIGPFSRILRERTDLPEDVAQALIRRAMAKAFDDWENIAEIDDPGEWVVGYALQLYRKFKLPDEDDSWTYGEAGPVSSSGPSSPSITHVADVRVAGALARITEIFRPDELYRLEGNSQTDKCRTISFYCAGRQELMPSGTGSDAVITELFRTNYRSLVRMATLLVQDDTTAEEVVQESFIALHGARQSIDCGYERSLSYLRQNVVNRSRSVLTYRAVEDRLIGPTRELAVPSAEEDTAPFLERSVVIDAIRSLPARQREALVLRYYCDLSEVAIAEVMGISRGAVKYHTARAMASLRTALPDTSEPASAPGSLVETRTEWINFYDTHYHRVIRFVMLHSGASLEDAQDAAHEAFTESWEMMATDPARWRAITNQSAWIRTVAVRRHRRPPGPRIRSHMSADAEIPDLPCPDPGPGEMTAQTQTVLLALSNLDAESRTVMAFYLDDFTVADIASALGVTEQRVRDMQKRARATLKRALGVNYRSREQR